MATETAQSSALPGVIAYFQVSDAKAAAAFYEKAFNAKLVDQKPTPDGRLMHCHVEINGGALMFSDPFPEHGMGLKPTDSFVLHLAVKDPKAWWRRAVDAGLEVVMPLEVAFWGDLYGQLRDPFGIAWGIVGPANAE